jgi:structural hemagglutinin/hemolysin toxin protein RtxA
MYQIIFYVPEKYCEEVKKSLFKAGTGKIGDYDSCAWQVLGQGQFRPLKNSNAFIGEVNQLERLAEYRVEMVCDKALIKIALQALINAHPFETPAYSVI